MQDRPEGLRAKAPLKRAPHQGMAGPPRSPWHLQVGAHLWQDGPTGIPGAEPLARIPDHIIEQVREAHDIVEIVRRAVPLKQAGAGFKGLCPFHDEKTPSFTVSPSRQTFKCFGCGKGGNVFGFLMETAGLSFPEAVRQLADERAIIVPDDGPADPALDERSERMRGAWEFAPR